MPLWYKLPIQGLFCLLIFFFIQTVLYGRMMAATKRTPVLYAKHKSSMHGVLCTLISALVLLVSYMFMMQIRPTGPLFWWHESFAVTFFMLFLFTRFKFTGERYPGWWNSFPFHRRFAYATAVFFAAAMATGIPLLWTMPHGHLISLPTGW